MAMRFNHSERINKYHSYAALGSVQEHPLCHFSQSQSCLRTHLFCKLWKLIHCVDTLAINCGHGIFRDTHCSLYLGHRTFKTCCRFKRSSPIPVTATVTGRSFWPALEIFSPVVFNFSPVAAIFCIAVADWFACVSSFFNSCSAAVCF